MKLSTMVSYSGGFKHAVRGVIEMEKAGLDLVWVPEAYGFDGPSQMGYLAALTSTIEIGSGILPIYTRTPSLLAMTAAGVDALSDGRFHLGLGASGPQVIEGFHGVQYTNPLGRTREVIEICRDVWRREAPLVHDGKNYTIPLPSDQGTGLAKALKIITHPVRPSIPIWIAALVALIILGFGLSGCVAYDVASTAVDVTGSVIGTAADITGDVVSAPFGSGDKKSKD